MSVEIGTGEFGEKGIKCLNYKLCHSVLPDWWLQCKGRYLCINCDMVFGTWSGGDTVKTGKGALDFKDSIDECPICLDTDIEGVSFPNCDHFACVKCMERLYHGEPEIPLPPFPYDDTEQSDEAFGAYCDFTTNGTMTEEEAYKKYPLLEGYHLESQRIDKLNDELEKTQADSSISLDKCPQCGV